VFRKVNVLGLVFYKICFERNHAMESSCAKFVSPSYVPIHVTKITGLKCACFQFKKYLIIDTKYFGNVTLN
jgi:hypothetical protein